MTFLLYRSSSSPRLWKGQVYCVILIIARRVNTDFDPFTQPANHPTRKLMSRIRKCIVFAVVTLLVVSQVLADATAHLPSIAPVASSPPPYVSAKDSKENLEAQRINSGVLSVANEAAQPQGSFAPASQVMPQLMTGSATASGFSSPAVGPIPTTPESGIPKEMMAFTGNKTVSAQDMTPEQQEFFSTLMKTENTNADEQMSTMMISDGQLRLAGIMPGFAYPAFCAPGFGPSNRFFCASLCPYGFNRHGLFCESICPWGYRQYSLTCNRPFYVMKSNTLDCPYVSYSWFRAPISTQNINLAQSF